MQIEIPRPPMYRLFLEADKEVSDEVARTMNREPVFLLPTLPYAGLRISGKYNDYDVTEVGVDLPQEGEEVGEEIVVYVKVTIAT